MYRGFRRPLCNRALRISFIESCRKKVTAGSVSFFIYRLWSHVIRTLSDSFWARVLFKLSACAARRYTRLSLEWCRSKDTECDRLVVVAVRRRYRWIIDQIRRVSPLLEPRITIGLRLRRRLR